MRRGSTPPGPDATGDPALRFALDQLAYYEGARDRARVLYRTVEVLLLVVTAATTLAAALRAQPALTAGLAAVAVVLTGTRRTFDWQYSWISYADAWTRVRVLVNEYSLLPEQDQAARAELMRRVDDVALTETSGWAARRSQRQRAGD
jgi:hypothetical protein